VGDRGASGGLPVQQVSVGTYTVTARPGDLLRIRHETPGCADDGMAEAVLDGEARATVVLGPEAVIEGTVVDDLGQPVPHAWISCVDYAPPSVDRSVAADAEGRFRLDGLRAAKWQLEIQADGHATLPLEDWLVARDEWRTGVTFTLQRSGEVRGRVEFPDGEVALPDDESRYDDIVFVERVDGEGEANTTLDASAEFVARGLVPGRWRFTVPWGGEAEANVVAGEVTDLELVTPRWPVVRGHVWLDGPAAGAQLRSENLEQRELERQGWTLCFQDEPFTAESGADGSFALPIRGKGRFAVWAELPGGGRTAESEVSVGPGLDAALDLHFGKERLQGLVVRAEDGAPLAGVRVQCGAGPGLVTGEDGRFALVGLQPGAWTIYATAKGYADGASDELAVGTIAQPQELRLALHRSASLVVDVVRADEQPVASKPQVHVWRLDGPQVANPHWGTWIPWSSHRPTLPLDAVPPGRYVAVAVPEGTVPSAKTREAIERAALARLEFVLAPGEKREITLVLPAGL
jgi:hypothetical protein